MDFQQHSNIPQKKVSNPADLLLPPKVWEQIFQHLSAGELLPVRLTCRRWKDIVSNSATLLEKFSIQITDRTLQNRNLFHFPPVSKLYIGNIGLFRPLHSWWPALGKTLVSLTFDDCALTLPTLIEMLAQTPALRKLKLNRVTSLADRDCKVNFRLENLEKLSIGWIVHDEILVFFANRCPRLRSFKIHDVQMDEGMERIIFEFVEAAQDTLEYIALCRSERLLEQISNSSRLKMKRVQFGKCDQLDEFSRINFTVDDVARVKDSE